MQNKYMLCKTSVVEICKNITGDYNINEY